MTKRKAVLSSMLFLTSGCLLGIGLLKREATSIISAVCGVTIATICLKEGFEEVKN